MLIEWLKSKLEKANVFLSMSFLFLIKSRIQTSSFMM